MDFPQKAFCFVLASGMLLSLVLLTAGNHGNLVGDLKQLAQLYKEGALQKDEFVIAKAIVLKEHGVSSSAPPQPSWGSKLVETINGAGQAEGIGGAALNPAYTEPHVHDIIDPLVPGVTPDFATCKKWAYLHGKQYGNTFNGIIIVALALRKAHELDACLRLDKQFWTGFFLYWFDFDRVNIRGPVRVLCSVNKTDAEWKKEAMVATLDPKAMYGSEGGGFKKLFAMHPLGTLGVYLQQILPKHKWRAEVEQYLKKLNMPAPLTVVHARRFEGQCYDRLNTGTLLCRNPAAMQGERVDSLMGACNMTTDYIDVKKAVLVSDGQFWTHAVRGLKKRRPKNADSLTGFPDGVSDTMYTKLHPGWVVSQGKKDQFSTDIWIMLLADEFWGNPASSIGFVLSEWRRNRPTFPAACYSEPKGVKLDYPGWTWQWSHKDVLEP